LLFALAALVLCNCGPTEGARGKVGPAPAAAPSSPLSLRGGPIGAATTDATAAGATSPVAAVALTDASVADVVQKVIDGVVNVGIKRLPAERPVRRDEEVPDEYDPGDPIGDAEPDPTPEFDSGSGVILSPDGLIVTTAHVVRGATSITVGLRTGESYPARVLGLDPATDLALLRIAATGLTPIPLGDSGAARIGQFVLAIGNPYQFGHTVTLGIISAMGRSGSALFGEQFYASFLQTDAAINPGNSGGALIDLQGRLIGINAAIASESGGYQGIGFAVPSTLVRKIVAILKERGKVVRGWIGVGIQDLTPDLAQALGVPGRCGVLVNQVYPTGPARAAGVLIEDAITAFGGAPTCSADDLRNAASLAEIGKVVPLRVVRRGKALDLPVRVQEYRPGELGVSAPAPPEPESRRVFGMKLVEASPGGGGPTRVIVDDVAPGSQADEAGIDVDDVLVRVEGREVASLAQLDALLATTPKRVLVAYLQREDEAFFRTFRR
jgi:Do/DeqQ family serine protease